MPFEYMQKSTSLEILLVYPNFSKPFVFHIDACKIELGAVKVRIINQLLSIVES